jgi:O-antigen ligase
VSVEAVHQADLEPFEVARSTYTTRRRFGRIDATSILCLMLALAVLIPEPQVLPGGSYVTRPALILCLGMFCWWVFARISPWLPITGRQPIRWALYIFMISMIVSYAVGSLRGLTGEESNSADNVMISALELVGIVLIAADGIATWSRLRTLVRVFLVCCAFLSVIAVVQYVSRTDVVGNYMYWPGLSIKGYVGGLQLRGGEVRAAATAGHPIELSTVLAIALPFAVVFSRWAADRKARRRWMVVALGLMAGNVATVSRTGLVSIAIGLLPLIPLWDQRRRYNALVLGGIVLVGAVIANPGMARTFIDLFAGDAENSIGSRTERYNMVGYYFSQRPWLGRGTGTWVSPQYQFLDNSWLAWALTNGVIGVAALGGVFLTAIAIAWVALRRATTSADKELCAAVIAAQLISIFATYTYDSMYFSTGTIVIFLMAGLAGAVWRLTHPDRAVRTAAPRRPVGN